MKRPSLSRSVVPPVFRATLAAAALIIAVSVLWMAGERHRENCVRGARIECSVLPWDSGEPRAFNPPVLDSIDRADIRRAIAEARGR